MNKQYKILTASLAVSMSLLFTGCGTNDTAEKDTQAESSKVSKNTVKKEETIIQSDTYTDPVAKQKIQNNNGNADEKSQNKEINANADKELDSIETCGFVIEVDTETQTMLIAEGLEEAPRSMIEAKKTGVSYYIGEAAVNSPCRISSGLVVYFTYYMDNGVNIVTEITSDGDEKEPDFEDYEYEYPSQDATDVD